MDSSSYQIFFYLMNGFITLSRGPLNFELINASDTHLIKTKQILNSNYKF